ncbi:MAG: hypothetical protein IKU61_02610 [Clostridia bacterium]|nr:hypothetical protein [Clostridia bacterium]
MKKIARMNEAAWVLGVVLCAIGVSLCTKANFGLSMVAAPAYIIHVFFRDIFHWYTQGTSEYVTQGVILIIMCIIIRRFRAKYLLTFVCAIVFGLAVDGCLFMLGGNAPYESMTARIIAFILGETITAVAIACYFRTDLPLGVYELAVSEIAKRYNLKIDKVKQANDIIMLVVSVILAFVLNRSFAGIGIGTIIITVVNAPLITFFGKLLDKFFTFEPRFPRFVEKIKL